MPFLEAEVRGDKHFAKMVAANNLKNLQHKGNERMQCLLHSAAGPSLMTSDPKSGEEPYESAMDYGVTTDALPYEASDSEEESDDVVAYDTETSHLMMVADCNCQRKKQQQRRDWHEKKKQRECRARGATLPLFKNSTKEGAMMYIDWRNSVDELVQDKVSMECIKSLVLQSLEGPLKDTTRLANKRRKCLSFAYAASYHTGSPCRMASPAPPATSLLLDNPSAWPSVYPLP